MGMRSGEVTPPFLRKVYHMVDDASCEDIVSWSEEGTQFTIHQANEFASELLPKYFKHSNFSSFVRQLNSYGFRKVKNTSWSFENVHFRKGHKDDLTNIKRRMGAKGRGEAGSGVGADAGKGAPEGDDRNVFEERQLMFETRLHQEIQFHQFEVAHLVHRISKVEHIQEELLRILINPTAQLDEAARAGGSGYGDAPVTINGVLEGLYKQLRDGRGSGPGQGGHPGPGGHPGAHGGMPMPYRPQGGGMSIGGMPPPGSGTGGIVGLNANIAAATQAGMAAGMANPLHANPMANPMVNPAFLGIYDPAQIEAFYQGARSGNGNGGGRGGKGVGKGQGYRNPGGGENGGGEAMY